MAEMSLELDKVAPFLIKLFEIVSSPGSDDLVTWSEHGESFCIIDRTKFAQARAPARDSRARLASYGMAHSHARALRSPRRMCCPCTSSTTTCARSSAS